jgi:hypothetical protein
MIEAARFTKLAKEGQVTIADRCNTRFEILGALDCSLHRVTSVERELCRALQALKWTAGVRVS